jgi:hypothetical protein
VYLVPVRASCTFMRLRRARTWSAGRARGAFNAGRGWMSGVTLLLVCFLCKDWSFSNDIQSLYIAMGRKENTTKNIGRPKVDRPQIALDLVLPFVLNFFIGSTPTHIVDATISSPVYKK